MRAPLQLSNFWNTENPALVIANRFKQVGAGRPTQCRAYSRAYQFPCRPRPVPGHATAHAAPVSRHIPAPAPRPGVQVHTRSLALVTVTLTTRTSKSHTPSPSLCLCPSNAPTRAFPPLKLRGQLFRTRRKLPPSKKSQRLAWPSTQEISLASHCPSSKGVAASPLWLLGKPRNRKTAFGSKDHRRVRVQHTRERGPPRNSPP